MEGVESKPHTEVRKRVNCRQLIGFKENRFTQVVVVVAVFDSYIYKYLYKN